MRNFIEALNSPLVWQRKMPLSIEFCRLSETGSRDQPELLARAVFHIQISKLFSCYSEQKASALIVKQLS